MFFAAQKPQEPTNGSLCVFVCVWGGVSLCVGAALIDGPMLQIAEQPEVFLACSKLLNDCVCVCV